MTDDQVSSTKEVICTMLQGVGIVGVVGGCQKHPGVTFDAYLGCPVCAQDPKQSPPDQRR